jgi:hypothetical protein
MSLNLFSIQDLTPLLLRKMDSASQKCGNNNGTKLLPEVRDRWDGQISKSHPRAAQTILLI